MLNFYGTGLGSLTLGDAYLRAPGTSTLRAAVGGLACSSVVRATGDGGVTVLRCTLNATLLHSGSLPVIVDVAGQTGLSSTNGVSVLATCGFGYFTSSKDNFTRCFNCPANAMCTGGDAPAVPMAGFFTLSGLVPTSPVDMSTACPFSQSVFPDSCVVPCLHSARCLANKVCAPGYVSSPPSFRCDACATGFYRTGSSCLACPSSGLGLFIAACVLVALCAAFAVLRRTYHDCTPLTTMSIAVDYLQLLAVFGFTGVAWSDSVRTMLVAASAFMLNLEIVAPECTLQESGVTFTGKFAVVVAAPLVACTLLLAVAVSASAWKTFVAGRRRSEESFATPLLWSVLLLLANTLYIYEAVMTFEVFNCVAPSPAVTDAAGVPITYLSVTGEPCGSGTQAQLMWVAVAACVVYLAGYPTALLTALWRRKELIMEDQLLRAKGTGNDKLSNPNALTLRRSLGAAYWAFTPEAWWWTGVLLLRKLLLVFFMLVVFNGNAGYQSVAGILVLLCAYGAHVRNLPYMSPGTFRGALDRHAAAVAGGDPLATRLAGAIASVEARGRKRGSANTMYGVKGGGKVSLLPLLSTWLFVSTGMGRAPVARPPSPRRSPTTPPHQDPNFIESMSLFSLIVVASMGSVISGSVGDPSAAAAAGDVVIAVVALTLIFMFVVGCITDGLLPWLERSAAETQAKGSARLLARKESESSLSKAGLVRALSSKTGPGMGQRRSSSFALTPTGGDMLEVAVNPLMMGGAQAT